MTVLAPSPPRLIRSCVPVVQQGGATAGSLCFTNCCLAPLDVGVLLTLLAAPSRNFFTPGAQVLLAAGVYSLVRLVRAAAFPSGGGLRASRCSSTPV